MLAARILPATHRATAKNRKLPLLHIILTLLFLVGAIYADMYDDLLLSGKIYYYPNGQPRIEERYDAKVIKRIERRFDEHGQIICEQFCEP